MDEDFRLRMRSIVDTILYSLAAALRRGQATGQVRRNIPLKKWPNLFHIEGAYATAKVRKEAKPFQSSMIILSEFLDTLRQ